VTTNGSANVWDVIGERSRREILLLLAEQPRPVGELAAALPISRPAVSQHLRVMKDAGLVSDTGEGTRRVYRVEPAALLALRDQLDTFWARTLAGFEASVTDTERTDKK